MNLNIIQMQSKVGAFYYILLGCDFMAEILGSNQLTLIHSFVIGDDLKNIVV